MELAGPDIASHSKRLSLLMPGTYRSPGALGREGVRSTREDPLSARQQHLHEVVAARLGLTFVLTHLHLLGWRRPRSLLQLRQVPQRQPVQRVPADRHHSGNEWHFSVPMVHQAIEL